MTNTISRCFSCGTFTAHAMPTGMFVLEDTKIKTSNDILTISNNSDVFYVMGNSMSSNVVYIGKTIHHGGENKLHCLKCELTNCGAPDCVSCGKNQIHYCDRCDTHGADHRARNCPNPLK